MSGAARACKWMTAHEPAERSVRAGRLGAPPDVFEMSIAIDGWSGSGKTSLAMILGTHTGLPMLHTGMLFRSLASSRHTIPALLEMEPAQAYAELSADECVSLPGFRTSGRIAWWTAAVTRQVSNVAEEPRVRSFVRTWVRQFIIATSAPAIVEGRDIGKCVLPEAQIKIFLTCPNKVIAARDADALKRNELDRKFLDMLCFPMDDTIVFDTSGVSAKAIALDIASRYTPKETR